MTGRLVALDLPGGERFVAALEQVWADDDAAFPVDQRLPAPARAALLDAVAPTHVVDADLVRHPLEGGRPVAPGDALVVATSGTTGAPRGVVLTHDAVRASATASSRRLGVTASDHWLACLPLSHVGGLSVVTRALHTGTRLTIHPTFDPHAAMDSGATLVSLVATALGRVDPTRFRTILLGGSRPPADRPPNCVATYGLTETGSGIVYDGRPLDGVELRIDGGTPEHPGPILVRAPMLFRGYRDGTEPFEDGWFRTDDLGHLEPDGRLVVQGRAGDLIITGGENVWPEQVERILLDHPGVEDVAVVGTPDPEWGHAVTAFVVPRHGPPTLAALRDHVRARLPAYAAPKHLVIVHHVPRTALGKIARHRLVGDLPDR